MCVLALRADSACWEKRMRGSQLGKPVYSEMLVLTSVQSWRHWPPSGDHFEGGAPGTHGWRPGVLLTLQCTEYPSTENHMALSAHVLRARTTLKAELGWAWGGTESSGPSIQPHGWLRKEKQDQVLCFHGNFGREQRCMWLGLCSKGFYHISVDLTLSRG